jgi:hypothetical protein
MVTDTLTNRIQEAVAR